MHRTEWIVGRQIRGRKITWGGEMMNQCTRERIARKGKNMSEKPYERHYESVAGCIRGTRKVEVLNLTLSF